MSFAKTMASLALGGLLIAASAPMAFAQVGGGTELPSNAEPQNAKTGNGSMATKGGMKGGMMKKKSMMMKKKKRM